MWERLGWINWFWQFLCKGLSSFNFKWFCYSCIVLQFMLRRGFPLDGTNLQKILWILICFRLALLYSVFYYFFLHPSFSSSLCSIFNAVSSNIDDVRSVIPFANVFVFGDFMVHHVYPALVGLIDLSNNLIKWLTFLFGFLTDCLTPALLDPFFWC